MIRRGLDPEKNRQRQKDWRAQNTDLIKESKAKYNAETGYEKRRYQENKRAAYERAMDWKRKNKELSAMREAARRAGVKAKTPIWANMDAILGIYKDCALMRASGSDMQVDHIVPLNGATVSGLHWEGNLRIISASENSSKGNRIWPDMFEGAY